VRVDWGGGRGGSRSHTKAKPTTATSWHRWLSWGEDALSMWPLPMIRMLARKSICCTHLYFGLLHHLSFIIHLEMYATCVSDKLYKTDK